MRFRSLRCNGANLLGSHALDFNTLQPAPLTRGDFNSAHRHIQMSGQEAPQSLIGAILHGRNVQPNAQRALPFAINLITARARLHANHKTQDAVRLTDGDHFV